MRWTAFLLVLTMLFSPMVVFAQEEKPDAAVTPVAAMGEITEGERGIIFNSLQSNLSKNYLLISQEDYARAEEKAFEELEADQCTAEQCIRKIQDILQVDRLFVLQIIREKGFTQLSLTLTRADDKLAREDTCTECSIGDLHGKVKQLVDQIVLADIGKQPDAEGLVKDLAPGDEQALAEDEGGIPWWVWVVGVVAVGALAATSGGSEGSGDSGGGSTEIGEVGSTW